MSTHSLSPAVLAGIVSAEAAFCGLSEHDISTLVRRGWGDASVLVRWRGETEGRAVVRADHVAALARSIEARGGYVRDVLAVAHDRTE
jgi:hypothetical protein